MSRGLSPRKRSVQLVRGALFVGAAGGVLLGMALQAGLGNGWTAVSVGLAGGALALLGLAVLFQHLAFRDAPEDSRLPGDIYGKGTPAKAAAPPERAKLGGRVPFDQGKEVATRTRDPQTAKLYKQLEALNRQLQRAAVDLGLGQLSQEGYTMIVDELKKKRATVEQAIARRQLGPQGQGRAKA